MMGIEKVCKNAYIVKSLLSPWGRKSKYEARKWKCVSQACHRSSCSPVILQAASGLTMVRGLSKAPQRVSGHLCPNFTAANLSIPLILNVLHCRQQLWQDGLLNTLMKCFTLHCMTSFPMSSLSSVFWIMKSKPFI